MSKRNLILLASAIAILGAIVFVTSVTGAFVYDDQALIQHDIYVHSFADWPRWFVTDFWNVDQELLQFGARILYWRPLVTASYALDWKLGGGSPVWFHVMNLLLQMAASAFAFTTLRRWLGGAVWPAAAAALLFVVHPTKAESVAWISGRTDIICLLAVLVASLGIARRLSGKHGGIVLEIAGTIVAYLSKEQAIVLPCFAAVEVWVAAGRPELTSRLVRPVLRGAAVQAVVAVGYLAVRTVVLPIGPAAGGQHVPLFHHLLALLETLGRFFALTFAPHDLSIQQGLVHTIGGEAIHSIPYIALGSLSTIFLLAVAWRMRRTLPAVSAGILVYFVTVAPTSNLVQTGMATLVSERFLYLPLFGLAFALGALLERYGMRRWIAALIVLAAIGLGIQSLRRSSNFESDDTLWTRELELHPDSLLARHAAISRNLEAKNLYSALALMRNPTTYDQTMWEYVHSAQQVAGLMVQLVPDHATDKLAEIDKFCADLVAKRPARLDMYGVSFSLDLSSAKKDRELKDAAPRFIAIRADLQSRLGHDATAVELAQQAQELCPRCSSVVTMNALVLARAQRYDDALALLEQSAPELPERGLAEVRDTITGARQLALASANLVGPAALQNHATELAKLELWGRAFDVLAPYETEIARAPKFAVGFAELAFRAGEEAIARRVLAVTKQTPEIDALIADWTRKMGWQR